ncbi:MAG: tdcF [Gammaproteobacteria bacterium]|jgi:reactive intermediate/imine deaminase|nr:tdcF [Gammaproteobacteria bacterium]
MTDHNERKAIYTKNAPEPIGIYSQAVKVGETVYLSGSIGVIPQTGEMREDILTQIHQVFTNLEQVAKTCGATLQDCVKFTVYLLDLNHFPLINEVMQEYLSPPFPARTTVEVSRLPKGALVEVDAILVLNTKLAT